MERSDKDVLPMLSSSENSSKQAMDRLFFFLSFFLSLATQRVCPNSSRFFTYRYRYVYFNLDTRFFFYQPRDIDSLSSSSSSERLRLAIEI